MPSREPELYKDKIEVSLDGRQIFYLFFGGAVIVGLVFVIGVMVGRRVESRGHLDRADTQTVRDPLAALDQLERSDHLSFRRALTGGDTASDVEKAIGELEKRRAAGKVDRKEPEGKADKAEGKADKAEGKADKAEGKADKAEGKPDKLNRPERAAQADKPDPRPERAAQADKPDPRPERAAQADKADLRPERAAQADKADLRPVRAAQVDKADKPDSRPERADKADRSDKGEKPDRSEKHDARGEPSIRSETDVPRADKPDRHEGERKAKKHDDAEPRADKPVTKPDVRADGKSEDAKARFTLQLSSFQDKAEAEAFLSTMRSAGFQAYVTEADVGGKGTFYRVRLGSYRSLEAANDAKAEYEKAARKTAQVMRL